MNFINIVYFITNYLFIITIMISLLFIHDEYIIFNFIFYQPFFINYKKNNIIFKFI